MKRLAWRQIARLGRDGPLVSKHFEGGAASEMRIDFSTLPASMDIEARLSRMTRWIIEAEARSLPYAFGLGGLSLPAALGGAHREACLRALALYGADSCRAAHCMPPACASNCRAACPGINPTPCC
jgi:uncharacterized protein (DUF58 family)